MLNTRGSKRSLENASGDEAGLKMAKLGEWDASKKEQFKKDNKGCCWNFAENGECEFGEDCRFNHVTRDGEMIQERKTKKKTEKSVTNRKTKEECIAERELDEEDNIYTGKIKFIKKGYGFINIEQDITFKDLTATKKIYVMVEDIISGSDEGLKKDDKVIFKVYKDSMGLGAMDVMTAEESLVDDAAEVEKEGYFDFEKVVKEATPEPKVSKKKSTKRKSKKTATTKKVKKTTKRKSVKSKKN
jgi:cold shock CspA family protein